ncbi:uncharacterized protein EDB91DRAFT_1310362 [Suillus paluster]|uniref:uncharacterized protein n=1 Tax=Suillus paluster TaxID=48578 RepID=UPI001B880229|nr:uncharacterized protein EDB91DRAFT_1310362 [Suillus paluster]KAG1730262.1 hypothetical protein EDB91DRAFT_1310362 [Suillus paluster]
MLMEDPNKAIRPDFMSPEHQDEHQPLIAKGLSEEQAARSLAALWNVNNNADKERWALRQQCLQDIRQREEEDEEQRQQLLKDEQEVVRREERKKNKNKYAPLVRGKVPSDPTIIPMQYALRKLKVENYCELHYFTNKGLEDAKTSNLVAEPDAMVMLPSTDGLHSWVPAATVKDLKAAPIVKDENLSWEDFNEAAPRMISSMKKALLLYQSQQHHHWHMTVGTAQSWSLEELNQDLIAKAREELFNEK